MSVRPTRFSPVFMAETVTSAPAITAPVGSVIVPKTVASWVCAHAHAEYTAKERTKRRHGMCESCLEEPQKLPSIPATNLSVFLTKTQSPGPKLLPLTC